MDIQKHTGIYATSGDVRTAVDSGVLHNPYIAIVQDGNYLDWNGGSSPTPPEPVYSAIPLTFEIISGGTIIWGTANPNYARTIQYQKNDGEWISITSNTGSSAPSISVSAGDYIKFKGNNTEYCFAGYSNAYNAFSTGNGCMFNAKGNIMSLLYGDEFIDKTEFPVSEKNRGVFYSLFINNTGLISVEHLILPATILVKECYSNMFRGCTSLTTAPELPAATLEVACYKELFRGCSSLNYIKCLATDISSLICLSNWVNGVAASGTFVKNPAMSSWPTGDDGIPSRWTVIDAE